MPENTHHAHLHIVLHPVPHLQIVPLVMQQAKKEAVRWLQELKALREGGNKAGGILIHHQGAKNARCHSRKARGPTISC